MADFSEFLTLCFGTEAARQWWTSTKENPLASAREQSLASDELTRLAETR
jgi:hypothetical protein